MNKKTIRCLFLGDLVGEPGVALFEKWAPRLKEQHKIDAIFVNGENSAKNGKGISSKELEVLIAAGAAVITSGNHIWANKKIYAVLDESNVLIRPANYPSACPGKGHTIVDVGGVSVAVVNIQGRIFMREDLDCPFRTLDSLLTFLRQQTTVIFVDVHAEATSEKQVLAAYVDGRVSAVLGTHTHVQTSDERILPKGTAFISDLGCAGSLNSALGVETSIVTERFLKQMPMLFKIEKKGPMVMSGVWVEVDIQTGKATRIERVHLIDEEIQNSLG